MVTMTLCGNCGAEISNDNFCSKCGSKIESFKINNPKSVLLKNKSIYLSILLMFLVTDLLSLTIIHSIYDLLIIPLWNSGNLVSTNKAILQQAQSHLRLYHWSIYITALITALIQLILYQILINTGKNRELLNRYLKGQIIYVIIPSIHILLLFAFIHYMPLNYEFNYLLTRFIIVSFVVGLVIHFLFRLSKIFFVPSDKKSVIQMF